MFLDWVQTIFLLCFWCYPAFSYIFIFMSISRALGSNESFFIKVNTSGRNLLSFSGLMLNIAGLTFILEDGYRKVAALVNILQDKLLTEKHNIRLIKRFIKELESLRPLSRIGYFSITKGTLTSMVSVGITYIIIMVQFKIYVQTPNQHQLNLTSS